MPIDRGAIDAQLREIGEGERWWEQREFKDLPHVLHPDEKIRGLVLGRLMGRRRPRLRTRPWLIVVTSLRLICLRQERFARKQVEFAAGQLTRVDHGSRLRSYQITVQTPERRYRIRIGKADAFRFLGALAPILPPPAARAIHPDVEPLSWIPGITTVAALPGMAGIISKVSMLSPPDYGSPDQIRRLETTIERLQADVEQLQQNVAFLEELLQKRGEESAYRVVPSER